MISWLVIVILVALIFVFIKAKYLKHKAIWIVLILVIGVLYAGYALSVSKADIDWNSPSGVETAVKLYLAWLGGAFQNAKALTGQAVNQDWSSNKTDSGINGQTVKGISNTEVAQNSPNKFHK